MRKAGLRQRYYVVVSAAYILLGVIILVRSVMAQAVPVGVLGLVFVALGAIRLRDYIGWRGKSR
jgi:hypothetical protein